jgi:nicotinate-nucleotide--dimethylbenzimidazole phosphoribosyltransferase
MTTAECEEAFAIGQKLVEREVYEGVNFLFLNSFGKGEDISFFALLAALKDKAFTDLWESDLRPQFDKDLIDDLSKSLRRHPISHDPFTILSFFGSFETAALCGAIIKGAEKGIALILNSPMAKVAALICERINSKSIDYCIYSKAGFFESERQQFAAEGATIPYLSMGQYKIQEPYYLAGEIQVFQALLEELAIP